MGRKRLVTTLKLQIPAGQASPAPPVGTALGPHGVNIMDFVRAYNDATASQTGTIVPVEVSIYEDRSFTFVTKTPPAAVLLRQAAQVPKGFLDPPHRKGGTGDQSADPPDRRDKDARSQRQRRRPGDVDDRGDRPLHGYRRRRLTTSRAVGGLGKPPARLDHERNRIMPRHGKKYWKRCVASTTMPRTPQMRP